MVMTLHRLTAGAGYRYLLRHVATGDCTRGGGSPVTAYYTESGNPPGRWFGRGLDGLGAPTPGASAPGLAAGAVVVEDAMARAFAHGLDPLTGCPLGRPYAPTKSPADRVAARVELLPEGMTPEARQAATDAISRVELARESNPTIAGFDLTFTVMKSVSTLWALGDPKVQQAVLDAHRRAVAASLAFFEDHVLFTRTGAAGCRQESTRGAIAAGFEHWDSRAGDPNLHTHVVVANKVQGLDGRWRSVDSRALHHGVVALSELYEALLVDEVARGLPVRWGWRSRGPRRSLAFELDGVADELMAAFSQRSTQIDAAMTRVVAEFAASRGRAPNRIEILTLRQRVTRATRPAKQVHGLGWLLERWRRRAGEVTGLSPQELTAQVIRDSWTRPVGRGELPSDVIARLAGDVLAGVRERRSTWTRWNVVAETLRVTKPLIAASPRDRLAITNAVTDAVLTRCVSLEAPAMFTDAGRYARADGTSVFDRPAEHTWTDAVILDAERDLLAAATDTSGPTALILDADLQVEGVHVLAADQVAAAEHVARSGRRVDLLVGPAGSGKTTTLAAVRRVWERQHGRGSVIGLAPSSTAAANLAGALGVACENTAKWLHESTGLGGSARRDVIVRLQAARVATPSLDLIRLRTIDSATDVITREERRWQLRPGQLVIVDEASLAGTLALRELGRQAQSAGAKVVLVGDHAQLSAVDAGGAFGLLADRAGGAHLRTLWRFTHRWEGVATAKLRTGDPRVLDTYDEAGRLHSGPTESMLEDAYAAWSTDVADGATAILLAPDVATVAALNTRAHNDRVQDGLVQPDGITTKDGTEIGVGDRIVTRLNDRQLRAPGGFVRNGDLWDVHAIAADGSLIVVPARTRLARRGVVGTAGSDPSAPVALPAGYVAENVDLAYATTTHRAQGITVDRAHLLAHAGMTRENLYVAMTRGRDANHVYVAIDDISTDCDDLPDQQLGASAHDVLTAILATSGAEHSATATIAARLDEAASLRRLEPIARTLYADATMGRWTNRLRAIGVGQPMTDAIERAPDAGRLLAALDRVASLATDPDATVRGLLDVPASPNRFDTALHRTTAWLRRHSENGADLPMPRNAAGLDPDGRALLAQVERLIAERVDALTRAAIDEQPTWLTALGSQPQRGAGRDAWIAAVAAHSAHRDRHTPDYVSVPTHPTPDLTR